MLQCGHSVCKECITRHLHPFKKDSMILCEKCTKSTIAMQLKDSVVLDNLVFNFSELVKILKTND